jgi:hypothetical protein
VFCRIKINNNAVLDSARFLMPDPDYLHPVGTATQSFCIANRFKLRHKTNRLARSDIEHGHHKSAARRDRLHAGG